MNEIVKEIIAYFKGKDFHQYNTKEKLQLFYDRIYLIIGFVVTPLISFIFTEQFTYWELVVLQLIGGIFFTVFILSFTPYISPRFVNEFLFLMFLLCSSYAITINYLYKFSFDKVIGSLIIIFSTLSVLQKKHQIIIYYLYVSIAMLFTLYILSDDVYIDKHYFSFFYMVGISIFYFNTHNKTRIYELYTRIGNLFEKLFKKSPVGLILVDNSTLRIIKANKTAENLLNNNIEGRYIDSFIKLSFDKNNYFQTEFKNNKGQFLSIKANKYIDEEEGREYVLISMTDITETKELQNLLSISSNTYLEIFQKADNYYLILNKDGQIIDINEKVTKTFGYTIDEIKGKYTNIFIAPEDYDKTKLKNILIKALQGKKIYNTFWVKDKYNNKLLFDFIVKKINYFQKDSVLIRANDITDKHIILENLKEREKRLQIIADTSINCIVFSQNGIITDVNKQTTQLLEYSYQEMIGKTLFDFIADQEDIDRLKKRLQTPETETKEYINLKLKTKSGKIKHIRSKGKYIEINGKKTRVSIFIDITSIIESQKKLVQSQLITLTNKSLKHEIEERKKAQQELLEYKNYMQSIIDSSINMIITTNKNRDIIEFNPAAEKTFKYKKSQVFFKKIDILYASPMETEKVFQYIQNQGFFKGEILNRAADGNLFTSFLTATAIKNKEGEIIGYMGISRDITQEKQLEETLIDIFNNTTNLIQNINNDFNITFVNKAWLHTLEYEINEIQGKSIFDFVPEEEKARCSYIREKLQNSKYPLNVDLVFQSKSGRKIYVEGTLIPKYENNTLKEIRGFFKDVTVSKIIRQQLEQNEERYRAIFNQAHVGIVLIDETGKILKSNHSFAKLFDKNPIQIEKENITNYLPSSLILQQFKQNEKIKNYQIETSFHNKNYSFIISNTIIADSENEKLGIIVVEDITNIKEAEKELKNLLKEKEVLLKEVHHRVKNNLQVISSILNLQTNYIDDKKIKEILLESQNRVRSMALVHEVLYKSHNFSQINFKEYITTLIQNIQMTYFNSKSIILQSDIQVETMPIEKAVPIGLIINELISNAYKHAFKNKDKGLIQLKISRHQKKITITVKDNGIGIDENINIEKINSLGLQLVQSLVQQINAKLSIENIEGSKFTITFEENK